MESRFQNAISFSTSTNYEYANNSTKQDKYQIYLNLIIAVIPQVGQCFMVEMTMLKKQFLLCTIGLCAKASWT